MPVYDCGCGLEGLPARSSLEGAQLPRGINRFLPAILGVDPTRVAEIRARDRPRGSGTSHYGLSRVAIVFRDLLALPLLVRACAGAAARRSSQALGAIAAMLAVGAAGGRATAGASA